MVMSMRRASFARTTGSIHSTAAMPAKNFTYEDILVLYRLEVSRFVLIRCPRVAQKHFA